MILKGQCSSPAIRHAIREGLHLRNKWKKNQSFLDPCLVDENTGKAYNITMKSKKTPSFTALTSLLSSILPPHLE